MARRRTVSRPTPDLELYPYYRRTERMLENILRDEQTMPIVKRLFSTFRAYIRPPTGR